VCAVYEINFQPSKMQQKKDSREITSKDAVAFFARWQKLCRGERHPCGLPLLKNMLKIRLPAPSLSKQNRTRIQSMH
jgi:hypothetical protein